MTTERLQTGLHELGLKAGDVVLVHTSMNGLGPIDGGADAVIDALVSVVGGSGTLLFPTRLDRRTMRPAILRSSISPSHLVPGGLALYPRLPATVLVLHVVFIPRILWSRWVRTRSIGPLVTSWAIHHAMNPARTTD